jgi:hypothetical protein
LDRNIVVFSDTFVACEGINDGKQTYFIFTTSKGNIYLQPTLNPKDNKQIINI